MGETPKVALQPLAQHFRQVQEALGFLGQPLLAADAQRINAAMGLSDEPAAVTELEHVLDQYALAIVDDQCRETCEGGGWVGETGIVLVRSICICESLKWTIRRGKFWIAAANDLTNKIVATFIATGCDYISIANYVDPLPFNHPRNGCKIEIFVCGPHNVRI